MDLEDRLRKALAAEAKLIQERQPTPPPPIESQGTHGEERHRRPGLWTLVAATALLGVASLIAVTLRQTKIDPSIDASRSHQEALPQGTGSAPGADVDGIPGQGIGGDPSKPSYPARFQVSSVEAAQDVAPFQLTVPDTEWTKPSDLLAVYVLPGNAVALDYRSPSKPASFIRQEYIEVYQAPWNLSKDAAAFYEQMLEADPMPEASVLEIQGNPAFAIEAHAKADAEQANPAFLRVVVGDIEFQISGGEDLARLESIATALMDASGDA